MIQIKAVTKFCDNGVNLPGVCGAPKGKTLFDGECFNMTKQDINNFPNVSFVVKGVSNEKKKKII